MAVIRIVQNLGNDTARSATPQPLQSRCEGSGNDRYAKSGTSTTFVQDTQRLVRSAHPKPETAGQACWPRTPQEPRQMHAQEIACPHTPPVITVSTDFQGTLWQCLIRINVILLRHNFGCGSLA